MQRPINYFFCSISFFFLGDLNFYRISSKIWYHQIVLETHEKLYILNDQNIWSEKKLILNDQKFWSIKKFISNDQIIWLAKKLFLNDQNIWSEKKLILNDQKFWSIKKFISNDQIIWLAKVYNKKWNDEQIYQHQNINYYLKFSSFTWHFPRRRRF